MRAIENCLQRQRRRAAQVAAPILRLPKVRHYSKQVRKVASGQRFARRLSSPRISSRGKLTEALHCEGKWRCFASNKKAEQATSGRAQNLDVDKSPPERKSTSWSRGRLLKVSDVVGAVAAAASMLHKTRFRNICERQSKRKQHQRGQHGTAFVLSCHLSSEKTERD